MLHFDSVLTSFSLKDITQSCYRKDGFTKQRCIHNKSTTKGLLSGKPKGYV